MLSTTQICAYQSSLTTVKTKMVTVDFTATEMIYDNSTVRYVCALLLIKLHPYNFDRILTPYVMSYKHPIHKPCLFEMQTMFKIAVFGKLVHCLFLGLHTASGLVLSYKPLAILLVFLACFKDRQSSTCNYLKNNMFLDLLVLYQPCLQVLTPSTIYIWG